MSDSEKKEWFVDPNSGAASQPGGFVSAPVVQQSEEAEAPEVEPEVVEPEPKSEIVEPEVEQTQGENTEGVETVEPESANPRLGQPEPEPEPAPEEEDFSEVLSGNAKDVQKFLEENPDKREALLAAEAKGKNRKSIVEG